MRAHAILAILVGAFALAACGKPDSPETQLRAAIARGVAAVEKKDTGRLKGLISEKYTDAQGQDKRAVESLLRVYFLRNQSIHLVVRTTSVTLPAPQRALAVVYVGMAAQPVASVDELERLRADLYRFEFTYANEDGDWRVTSAEWRRVEFADFTR